MSSEDNPITACHVAAYIDHAQMPADMLKCEKCGMQNPRAHAIRLLERIQGKAVGSLSTGSSSIKRERSLSPLRYDEDGLEIRTPSVIRRKKPAFEASRTKPHFIDLASEGEESSAVARPKSGKSALQGRFGAIWHANVPTVNAARAAGKGERKKLSTKVPGRYSVSKTHPQSEATAIKALVKLNLKMSVWVGAQFDKVTQYQPIGKSAMMLQIPATVLSNY